MIKEVFFHLFIHSGYNSQQMYRPTLFKNLFSRLLFITVNILAHFYYIFVWKHAKVVQTSCPTLPHPMSHFSQGVAQFTPFRSLFSIDNNTNMRLAGIWTNNPSCGLTSVVFGSKTWVPHSEYQKSYKRKFIKSQFLSHFTPLSPTTGNFVLKQSQRCTLLV